MFNIYILKPLTCALHVIHLGFLWISFPLKSCFSVIFTEDLYQLKNIG